jgi:hypothetical protein
MSTLGYDRYVISFPSTSLEIPKSQITPLQIRKPGITDSVLTIKTEFRQLSPDNPHPSNEHRVPRAIHPGQQPQAEIDAIRAEVADYEQRNPDGPPAFIIELMDYSDNE